MACHSLQCYKLLVEMLSIFSWLAFLHARHNMGHEIHIVALLYFVFTKTSRWFRVLWPIWRAFYWKDAVLLGLDLIAKMRAPKLHKIKSTKNFWTELRKRVCQIFMSEILCIYSWLSRLNTARGSDTGLLKVGPRLRLVSMFYSLKVSLKLK